MTTPAKMTLHHLLKLKLSMQNEGKALEEALDRIEAYNTVKAKEAYAVRRKTKG